MTGDVRLVLASASPARRRLLAMAGVSAEVLVSAVDEEALASTFDSPTGVARGLAEAKARDVAQRLGRDSRRTLVVGCDSVLEVPGVPELRGRALGKPADAADAVRRWELMAGREGILHTGHCLFDTGPIGTRGNVPRADVAVATTRVLFADPSPDEIAAYVATGEPLRVAGAFTIDGLGAAFVRGVEGDWSNVVGLSLPLLREMVRRVEVFWPSLWESG